MDWDFEGSGGLTVMDAKEEVAAVARAKEGDKEAAERLVRCNMGAIAQIARRYLRSGGPEMPDLVQEGCIAVLESITTYDPSLGWRFLTYALHRVKSAIDRAMKAGGIIHIPEFTCDRADQVAKIANRLHDQLGRHATKDEIARAARTKLTNGRGGRITAKGMRRIIEFLLSSRDRMNVLSLDRMKTGQDGDGAGWEPSAPCNDPASGDGAEAGAILDELLSDLAEWTRNILKMHFGIGTPGGESMTLKEIAESVGMSRERVRQAEKDAMIRLKEVSDRLLARA